MTQPIVKTTLVEVITLQEHRQKMFSKELTWVKLQVVLGTVSTLKFEVVEIRSILTLNSLILYCIKFLLELRVFVRIFFKFYLHLYVSCEAVHFLSNNG